jgi:hypothetical protein
LHGHKIGGLIGCERFCPDACCTRKNALVSACFVLPKLPLLLGETYHERSIGRQGGAAVGWGEEW